MSGRKVKKGERVTNEKYRDGYDRIFGKEEYFDTKDAKLTVKLRCSKELADKIKNDNR